MKEIGGYIELDRYHLPMLHDRAVALNCGRNCLAYLISARNIRRLWMPKFICDSVTDVCKREGVPYSLYSIGVDFRISQEIELEEGEWLYIVNYYSQLNNDQIMKYVDKYGRVIVDNAQSYFQYPAPYVDTLYSCRKYFGVADGAFLYTDANISDDIPLDQSYERMNFVLGRYERPATEFYNDYVANNELFKTEPIKRMSKLTQNLLHGIDYEKVKETRKRNYAYLHERLVDYNILELCEESGTFMYPLLIPNGAEVKRCLQEKRLYIPTLWPSVMKWCRVDEEEYYMADNILPLPIDQRYGSEEMECMVNHVLEFINI